MDERILAEYLRRSYHAVDGLWFVIVEAEHDFEHALELDKRVWQAMAKIQARKARELLEASGNTPEELARCFSLKLTADGHSFTIEATAEGVTFTISDCPWLQLLQKSNRQHLAARIAQTICFTEGNTWCAEFGGEYEFEMAQMGCQGAACCVMVYRRR